MISAKRNLIVFVEMDDLGECRYFLDIKVPFLKFIQQFDGAVVCSTLCHHPSVHLPVLARLVQRWAVIVYQSDSVSKHLPQKQVKVSNICNVCHFRRDA